MTEVIDARRDGRWADASEALERWVASQRQAALGYAPAESSGSRPGSAARASVLTPRGMFSRQRTTSAASAELRDRVPRAARMLQKAGLGGERPLYLCYVQKRNEHGKVQQRLVVVTVCPIAQLGLACVRSKSPEGFRRSLRGRGPGTPPVMWCGAVCRCGVL